MLNQSELKISGDDFVTYSFQEQNAKAQKLIELGGFEEAERLCKTLVADYPAKPGGFIGLARIAFKQQDYALTLERCEQFLPCFPNDLQLLNFSAESLTALERFEEADQLYRTIIKIYPNKPIGYVGIARIAFKQQDYELTLERCEQFMSRFPNEFSLIRFKAESLISLERLDEATQICRVLTDNYPDKPNGFVGLVRIAFKQQDYELTLERCDTYLQQFPAEFLLIKLKAEALLALSLFDQAEKVCYLLTSLYPTKPVGHLLPVRIAYAKGQYDIALEFCNKILPLFPDNLEVSNFLGNILIAISRMEDAKQVFQNIAASYPDKPTGHLGMARVALAQSQPQEALKFCETAINQFPLEIEPYSLKGNTLLTLFRLKEAQYLFEKLTVDFPQHINGFVGLYQLFKRLEQHYPALDAIKKAYAIKPRNTYVVTQYGFHLELMGKLEEAYDLLELHVNRLKHDACIVPLVNLYSKYGETSKVLALLEVKREFFSRIETLQVKAGFALRNKGNLLASSVLFMNYLESSHNATFDTIKNKFKAYEQIKLFNGVIQNFNLFKNPFFASYSLPKPYLFNDDRYNEIISLMEAKEFGQCDSLLGELKKSNPNNLFVGFIHRIIEYAKQIDSISSSYAESYLDIDKSPVSAIQLSKKLIERIQNKTPTSLVRLGDGEGMFLEYPEQFKNWQENDKEHSQRIWWGDIKFSKLDNNYITSNFFDAVRNADILGIPTLAVMVQATANVEGIAQNPTHRGWRAIHHHIARKEFLDSKPSAAILTSWHCHNDLEFWDLYRFILTNVQSLTIITCHTEIGKVIQDKFGIRSVRVVAIPSEHRHSHNFNTHEADNSHFPDYFYKILATLTVETGEVFLVAAGFLGKIYCNEIKKKGGIGIDIGSIADKWMGYSTRGEHEYIHPIWGVDIDIDLLRKNSSSGYKKVEKQRYYRSNYYCDRNIYKEGDELDAICLVQKKSFLITGHPRCGSLYMSLLFSRFGFNVNHEWFGDDGICSWLYAVNDLNMPILGKQTIDPSASYFTQFDYTLAYVRNPFDAIPSILIENRGERSYNYRRNHIINELDIDLDDYSSDLERAIASYLFWNKIVQLKKPVRTFKVEDCIQSVHDFLMATNLINEPITIQGLDLPTNANSTISLGFSKPEIPPTDYSTIACHLKEELLAFCEHHGYEDSRHYLSLSS